MSDCALLEQHNTGCPNGTDSGNEFQGVMDMGSRLSIILLVVNKQIISKLILKVELTLSHRGSNYRLFML